MSSTQDYGLKDLFYAIFHLATFILNLFLETNTPGGSTQSQTYRHPIILIPGLGDSRLEAKIDRNGTTCDKTQDWDTIYSDIDYLKPSMSECFRKYFELSYDTASRHTYNQEGVQIRPFEFGHTEGIQWNDKNHTMPYMESLVEALVAQNYTIDKSLRGAPFDFRKSPFDNGNFVPDFRALVEKTYRTNHNTPVYLVSHSFGGLYTLYFLGTQSQPWKDKYVKAFIPIAAPWGGSVELVRDLARGYDFNSPYIVAKDYRQLFRSFSSVYTQLPSVTTYRNHTLLSYNGVNYTANDYDPLFDLLNISNAKMMYHDNKALTTDIPHPMVDVHCIYSDGQKTVDQVIYGSADTFPDTPSYTYGDGDDHVSLWSLQACRRWSSNTRFKFNYTLFKNVTHVGLISNSELFELLKRIVSN